MINVQKTLAREVGNFFHNAWETLINAVAGKWGDVKVVINGKTDKVLVVKSSFWHAYEFQAEGNEANFVVGDEDVSSLSAIMIDKDTGLATTLAGQTKLSLPTTSGKSYFVVVFGRL